MSTLAAAVAEIPAASHLVQHLYLRSALPRRDGDVTVCTQCSFDRLERLEAQTSVWSGVICAAVMCPCSCKGDSLRNAKQHIQALHGRIESRGGPCRLDIVLVAHAQEKNSASSPCQEPWRYPINALRNVALRSAATELVILIDVDFLPGLGIQEQLWKMDVYNGYLRACTELRRVVILPALEEAPGAEPRGIEEILRLASIGEKDYLQSALQIVTGGKASVEQLWTRGRVRAFASEKYPRGHGPTDTGRWISSDATYEVQYEADYAPYFLCSRRLVPWYDERFTGYGKNKAVHVFHTAVLDFRFWVHPEWFVVHVHHRSSSARDATLGGDPVASKRLADVRRLYTMAKHEMLSLPTHTGVHLPPMQCACIKRNTPSVPRKKWYTWKRGQNKRREEVEEVEEELMGHWGFEEQPPASLIQSSTKKYAQALYDLRYHFCAPKLRPVGEIWPLQSNLPRKPTDITLVTVATADRLQRLAAQCRRWRGVICAAVYAAPNTNVKDLEKDLLALHLEVEKAATCRLDLILMEPVKAEKSKPGGMRFGRKDLSSHDMCPINGLRNAALALATTDLILILDVDLLPAPSLNDCLLDEQQYACLLRMAVEERTAVVVPGFEYAGLPSNPRSRNAKVEDSPIPALSALRSNSVSEMGKEKKAVGKESCFQDARDISEAEELTEKGVSAVCNGLNSGMLRGFHAKHHPAGHSPSNFEKWREMSETFDVGDRSCCEICRSYGITFVEGFEPFAICARKLIPTFDERFRGYGFDKVTFYYHLHLSGFRFQVLAHSFALDIPHPQSQDWRKTFGPGADPLQHIRVKALYQRAKRENRVVTGRSALANHVFDEDLMGSTKPSAGGGLVSKRSQQFRTASVLREKQNRPTLEGLQLAWQGVIHRQYSSDGKSSTEFTEEEEEEEASSVPSEEVESSTSFGSGFPGLPPQRDNSAGLVSNCLGWNTFWANCVANAARESKNFDSVTSMESLEEFKWDSAGWELKGGPDSLSNCSVVKAPQKDTTGDREWFQTGGYWLRVSMSAGSWNPHASRLSGIASGGVSVRAVLPFRAVNEVVVRYMVRFPSSFEWVKGGALPGLWINDIVQGNFGWRGGGEGHLSTALIGQSRTEQKEQQTVSATRKPSKLARPFYFVPEQWHAVQISVCMIDQMGTTPTSRNGTNVESNSQVGGDRPLSCQPSGTVGGERPLSRQPSGTVGDERPLSRQPSGTVGGERPLSQQPSGTVGSERPLSRQPSDTVGAERPLSRQPSGTVGGERPLSGQPSGTVEGERPLSRQPNGTVGDERPLSRQPSGTVGAERPLSRQPSGTVGVERPSSRQPSGTVGGERPLSRQPSGTVGGERPSSRQPSGTVGGERPLSRQPSGADGPVVELRAFVDFELVSTITYPWLGPPDSSRNSRDRGPSFGLLLSCHFGGKTEDWAAAEDTHIDFSQFEIWTD